MDDQGGGVSRFRTACCWDDQEGGVFAFLDRLLREDDKRERENLRIPGQPGSRKYYLLFRLERTETTSTANSTFPNGGMI